MAVRSCGWRPPWARPGGLVHGGGRAPAQGRGLSQGRHIAHPGLPPLPCCKFMMQPAPSPSPAPATAPRGVPQLCPPLPAILLLPLLRAVQMSELSCAAGGLGPICARRQGCLQAATGRGPNGPGSCQDPSILHQADTQPCPGVAASPAPTIPLEGRLLCPPPLLRAPPGSSVCRHIMAHALRIPKP